LLITSKLTPLKSVFLTSKENSMKAPTNRFLIAITLFSIIMYGCSKTTDLNSSGNLQSGSIIATGSHIYGLLPMTPDQYANVPLFSKEAFQSKLGLKALTVAPSKYTIQTPPVRDQGQIGSCTAFCGAETDEILQFYKSGSPGTSWLNLSPAFVYYCERVLILKQKITADNGAYMVNIPQALHNYGDCPEVDYPYPSGDRSTAYKTAPTSKATSDAIPYETGPTYAMVAQGDVANTKLLIANNTPVMMGFNVYDTRSYTLFEGLTTKSYTYNPLTKTGALVSGAKLLGGHAVPIIGYDDTKGVFLCQNSWGTSWGNKGFFLLPYSVFQSTKIVPAGNVYYATLN